MLPAGTHRPTPARTPRRTPAPSRALGPRRRSTPAWRSRRRGRTASARPSRPGARQACWTAHRRGGSGAAPAACASDGWRTREARPSPAIRRAQSCQVGNAAPSCCSQRTTDASSHHSARRGIARPCAPADCHARTASSEDQRVTVQKVRRRPASSRPSTKPAAVTAWPSDAAVCRAKPAACRQDRRRRRVALTITLPASACCDPHMTGRVLPSHRACKVWSHAMRRARPMLTAADVRPARPRTAARWPLLPAPGVHTASPGRHRSRGR